MRKYLRPLKRFFFPPDGTPLWRRVLPYAILGVLTLFVFLGGAYGWEYTNSPEFCGTACHTMPPEYTSYLTSPHARIDCVDCHIGKGFITTRITRKAGDAKHIIRLLFEDYEFPIQAGELRPARETCELCHFPEKFSDDSLREIKSFGEDVFNTPATTYLIMKTGGGSKRLGLGQGIHWHVENQVLYFAPDHHEQEIPYVQVVGDDGSISEYFDVESSVSMDEISQDDLKEMDCITCHNRITHLVNAPEDILDRLLEHGIVSDQIPEIKRVAVEIFYRDFESTDLAVSAIGAIENFYEIYYPDFYKENQEIVVGAIVALKDAYTQSVYPEQKSDWDSHPNNIGHQFSPGCFRCHDGKHLNEAQEAIRLECNVCHSIPVVAGPGDFVTEIEISRGPEPQSHLSPNWIGLHRDVFDQTCQNCHSVEDPGGTSNTSFCSNPACHGSVFTFAGFNAPKLREIWLAQLPPPPVVEETVDIQDPPTFENSIGAIFGLRCASCHGENATAGLDMSSYPSVLKGSQTGPVILPGDSENSLLVQTLDRGHFGQFTPNELTLVLLWIDNGAPEK